MLRGVHERPEHTDAGRLSCLCPEETRSKSKQQFASQPHADGLLLRPGEGAEQRQPGVLELRQLQPRHTPWQKLARDCLKARFGGAGDAFIELLEPFAPPGEADGAKPRIAARRNDVGECEIQIPQRREGGPYAAGQLLERDLAVVIEPSLSDSRRP